MFYSVVFCENIIKIKFVYRIFIVDITDASYIDTVQGLNNYSNNLFSINVFQIHLRITGRKVDELVGEEQSTGDYKYNFSAEKLGLQSGTYLMKLTVNNITYLKRIVEID